MTLYGNGGIGGKREEEQDRAVGCEPEKCPRHVA